jgi:hypothetical protein
MSMKKRSRNLLDEKTRQAISILGAEAPKKKVKLVTVNSSEDIDFIIDKIFKLSTPFCKLKGIIILFLLK